MLKSMTGFGRAEGTIGNRTFLIDIKSLNGKQFDLNLRLPAILKPYEFNLRKLLAQELLRGSVECFVSLKDTGDAKPVTINEDLAKAYYNSLSSLAKSIGIDPTHNILNVLVKLPEVITPSNEFISEQEMIQFEDVLKKATSALNSHRQAEGLVLENDLLQRINNIIELQTQLQLLDPQRKDAIKEGLVRVLENRVGKDNYDTNRLEQELIYYIEKIDITEEMTRLLNHCEYFKEIINENTESKGKKLSFILQEIGREINTTGSKAYHSGIQKIVVMMKDELEKAKEQVLNIL